MKFSLIITSAGHGKRFNSPYGKMFVDFQGTPLVIHTIKQFINIPNFSEIIITIEENKIQLLQNLINNHNFNKKIKIISGGTERQDSVKKAFFEIKPVDYVFIHDGARPNISQELINRLFSATKNNLAIIPGVPAIDTIKLVNKDSLVEQTLPRNQLFHIQTPQVFDYSQLKKIYQEIPEEIFQKITDEAGLFEYFQIPVKVIEGEKKNIKITYPEDLKML